MYPYSTSELEGVGGQCHAPPALPPGKGPGINYTGGWLDMGVVLTGTKILPPPGFKPKTIHSVASRYNNYATQIAEL
jgi:hypothetical protein